MESTIDLILKGHFETLKEKANSQGIDLASHFNLVETLKEVATYLEKDDSKKARQLRGKVIELLQQLDQSEVVKVKRKPMKKAGGKKEYKQDRKAM